jgi:4-hydroxybenzoate polyprenyltransferase
MEGVLRVSQFTVPDALIFASALITGTLAVARYFKPEIIGAVFGSLVVAYAFRTFRARGESTPLVRFFLGRLLTIETCGARFATY